MLISYNWLQSHFEKPLPTPAEVGKLFNDHSVELEGIEEVEGDFVLDLGVLPDRAHYMLSHIGCARELSAIIKEPLKELGLAPIETGETEDLSVTIESEDFCRRYMGRRVENVVVSESPDWIKNFLGAIGERSINSVVDATNLVMLDRGQPLHAFDADKVEGGITVRRATEGETMVLLDDTEVVLSAEDSVIADEAGPIAIAGVKGGKRAEVNMDTKNIIIEAANFDPIAVRKTSRRLKLINNSSKRFENEITSEMAETGMAWMSFLLREVSSGELLFGTIVDQYPIKAEQRTINVTAQKISQILGITVTEDVVIDILGRLGIESIVENDQIACVIPHERLDLRIVHDIADEVGRIHGLVHVKGVLPLENSGTTQEGDFNAIYQLKLALLDLGYSEIITTSFAHTGDVLLENPIASDKGYLRSNLSDMMRVSLEKNISHMDLLGVDAIKIFEIGKVFVEGVEKLALALGVTSRQKQSKNDKALMADIETLNESLPISLATEVRDGVFEVILDPILADVSHEVVSWDKKNEQYKPFSVYPSMTRDIAVWTPEGTIMGDIEKILLENAGELLVREPRLVDTFEKEGRTSYAFRLVFQSMERTLTDEEVNSVIEKITEELNSQEGFEVR